MVHKSPTQHRCCEKTVYWQICTFEYGARVENMEGWNTMTYDQIKEAIMKEYPAAIAMKNGSIEKLNQICRENQRIGENDLTELLNFNERF